MVYDEIKMSIKKYCMEGSDKLKFPGAQNRVRPTRKYE